MVEDNANNAPELSKRQIAYKMQISDILDNPYKKEEGWMPNYVLIGDLKVSRVNIIGVIISKEEENESENYVLSDNSGQIPLRFFKSPDYLKVGDIILLIGRPREFGSERYIVPEMIKKIEDQKWVEVRKKELELQIKQRPKPVEKIEENIKEQKIEENSNNIEESNINITISTPSDRKEEIQEIKEKENNSNSIETSSEPILEESPIEKLIKLIRENDSGTGITFEEISTLTEMVDIEKMLQKLLESGDIFEVKPGSYKVLE